LRRIRQWWPPCTTSGKRSQQHTPTPSRADDQKVSGTY
jgi:hypothetical protein